MDTAVTRLQRLRRCVWFNLGVFLIGGALTGALALEPHGTTRRLDPTLPGVRSGVLEQTVRGVTRIDGIGYPLAKGAIVQTSKGNQVLPKSLERMNGRQLKIQYWLGTDVSRGQIVQMLIDFPN
jgi:hypothetical protein